MTEPRLFRPSGDDSTTTFGVSMSVGLKQWLKGRAAHLGISLSYLITQLAEDERQRVEAEKGKAA